MPIVRIYGPHNYEFIYVTINNDKVVIVDNPIIVNLETLEEALFAYANYFRFKSDGDYNTGKFSPSPGPPGHDFWPDDIEPRYFIYEDGYGDKSLVDIHVRREEIEICPKQDLTFVLVEGDTIQIGQLVC